MYICPSAVAEGVVVYAIGGRRGTTLAVKAGGRGNVTDSHKLWSTAKGSNVSFAVYVDGHLYFVSESRGVAYCLDAKTGDIVYEVRLDPRPGRIYASPLAADGKLYYVSRENGTYVLPAKPEFEVLAHNRIESDNSIFNASPVPVDGKLLLRSDGYLYCVGN